MGNGHAQSAADDMMRTALLFLSLLSIPSTFSETNYFVAVKSNARRTLVSENDLHGMRINTTLDHRVRVSHYYWMYDPRLFMAQSVSRPSSCNQGRKSPIAYPTGHRLESYNNRLI